MSIFAITNSDTGWGAIFLTLGISIIALGKTFIDSYNSRRDKEAAAEQARLDREAVAKQAREDKEAADLALYKAKELEANVSKLKKDHEECDKNYKKTEAQLLECKDMHEVADRDRSILNIKVARLEERLNHAGIPSGDTGKFTKIEPHHNE